MSLLLLQEQPIRQTQCLHRNCNFQLDVSDMARLGYDSDKCEVNKNPVQRIKATTNRVMTDFTSHWDYNPSSYKRAGERKLAS